MKYYSEVIKELKAKKDIEGLKALRNYFVAKNNADVAYGKYVLSKYSHEEIEHAWTYTRTSPKELTNAIVLVYCDDANDIAISWLDEHINEVMESIKSETLAQAVWEQDFETLPERFEDFVEQCSVVYSNEVDIPVDELYERFVYLSNYKYEKLHWQDLLEDIFN